MILGLDYGRRRIGVAAGETETRLAHPVEVIDRQTTDAIARIVELVAQRSVIEVVVGEPLSLSGAAGPSAEEAEEFAVRLREALDVPVVRHDERLTTVEAQRSLRSAGLSTRRSRDRVDAIAAQVMLQGYLDGR